MTQLLGIFTLMRRASCDGLEDDEEELPPAVESALGPQIGSRRHDVRI